MSDAFLQWHGDLSVSPTGDIALAETTQLIEQRVLRRLLTNPGDYIWQIEYGAGLGQYIGAPVSTAKLQATIRSQIYQEQGVSQTPPATIDIQTAADGAVYLQMMYVDAQFGQTRSLTFSVSA